jgi:hypothetical protein
MIRLLPNKAAQSMYLSPFQARKYLLTFTQYLMEIKSMATSKTYTVILAVSADNSRYTLAKIGTHQDRAISGDIKIEDTGLYTFTIYGQNSSSNLDPKNATVVGKCQQGIVQIIGAEAWTTPDITVPNNVVYYE